MIGIIPAAGKGTRAYPYTKMMPKGMLKIHKKPVLYNTIEIMRDKLGIEDIVITVGHMSHSIKDYFGNGRDYGVKITYLENNRLDMGLAYSVLLAKDYVKDYCCVILSDEFYLDSNHDELARFEFNDAHAVCLIKEYSRNREIRKNYNVVISGDKITELIEKPTHPKNDILGCGTWVFHKEFFNDIAQEFRHNPNSNGNLIKIIDRACRTGKVVKYFKLKGEYININSRDDINRANNLARIKVIKHSKVSLVLPIGNDVKPTLDIISEFIKEKDVHEIVLVTQNPKQNLQNLIQRFAMDNVKLVEAPSNLKEYGEILKYGLEKATGDILVLSTKDEAFSPKDLKKLIMYICEADMVIGTRTTRQMIEQGANMNTVIRLANYFLAKMIELLWINHQVRLTDVGCIYRALWKDVFWDIRDDLESKGGEISAEIIIEVLKRRMRIIEIPINYCKTTDEHHIDLPNRKIGLFFKMIKLIVIKRVFTKG